jgi:exonuclease III
LLQTKYVFVYFNVCGLKRRIQYPEFLELVNDYDILCFVETKTDDVDEIDLPGFIIKMKNRFYIIVICTKI